MKSWIKSANFPDSHFPIQNLPFGAAKLADGHVVCVTAIGENIVDLSVLEAHGLVNADGSGPVFDQPVINEFMALGPKSWRDIRNTLIELLREGGNPELQQNSQLCKDVIISMDDVSLQMPFKVSEFTDFYAGEQHAKNMGEILRGSQALPANWYHIPIGYNGRASSVVVSGTNIIRPSGQIKPGELQVPIFSPTKKLDIELELGAVIGTSSTLGKPVTMAEAEAMIFGYVLLNDWSARDIQAWEYQPLGPFQGKAFATSISPWVVTTLALEEFRKPVPPRVKPLLPYLEEETPGLFDIDLEIRMRASGETSSSIIARTNFSRMYYSAAQQLCHHAIGGCSMRCGDLLGSGTISGPKPGEYGSLMELSWAGERPFNLDTGQVRSFVEDGDEMTLTGWAQGTNYRIGFGECSGKILGSNQPIKSISDKE